MCLGKGRVGLRRLVAGLPTESSTRVEVSPRFQVCAGLENGGQRRPPELPLCLNNKEINYETNERDAEENDRRGV